METMKRENPLFSLCGLNCRLCPRFVSAGTSKCPGCGGEGFADKHPTCAVATCNRKHGNVEYCFQCAAYPCGKYSGDDCLDSFISYRNVKENMAKAKSDLPAYMRELDERGDILSRLLEGYDEGRSKGLYCLVANDMPIAELRDLIEKADALPRGTDVKERAKRVKDMIADAETGLGFSFKLRTKGGDAKDGDAKGCAAKGGAVK